MTVTDVERFNILLPGRGKMYFGIVSMALDGYVNGTGFILTGDTFKVTTLLQVQVTGVDTGSSHFVWEPSTGALKAYISAGAEEVNDGLDGLTARIMYWGF